MIKKNFAVVPMTKKKGSCGSIRKQNISLGCFHKQKLSGSGSEQTS
jgi:hypothetical protein